MAGGSTNRSSKKAQISSTLLLEGLENKDTGLDMPALSEEDN